MSEKHSGKFQKISFMLFDFVVLYLGFSLADAARLLTFMPWVTAGLLMIFFLFDGYSSWHRKSAQKLVYTIGLAFTVFAFLLLAVHAVVPFFGITLEKLSAALVLQAAFLISGRLVIWNLQVKKNGKKKLFIVAEGKQAGITMAEKLLARGITWFEVAGYSKTVTNEQLAAVDVVLLSPSISSREKERILKQCMEYGKELLVVPDLFELSIFSSVSQQIDDMLILSVSSIELSTASRAAKRAIDLFVSVLILFLTAPVMAFLFAAIPLTSKGPALYSQERTGRNGKPYKLFKFRSMVQDAEKRTGPVLAADQDPRITKIGHVIRMTRLDELPQLFNVLKGEMSLVGPRPERPFFIEQFVKENPGYVNRLAVKPGLTGLAQVMANYTTTVEDKLRYDLLYIRNYSAWLDIKLLCQTICVVLQREQAAGVKETDMVQKPKMQQVVSESEAAGQ